MAEASNKKNDVENEDGVEEEISTGSNKDATQQLADKQLSSLTDRAKEKEMDSKKVAEAMAALEAANKQLAAEKMAKEKALAAVKVEAADVDLLDNELLLSKKDADRLLRESGGDALKAMQTYIA